MGPRALVRFGYLARTRFFSSSTATAEPGGGAEPGDLKGRILSWSSPVREKERGSLPATGSKGRPGAGRSLAPISGSLSRSG